MFKLLYYHRSGGDLMSAHYGTWHRTVPEGPLGARLCLQPCSACLLLTPNIGWDLARADASTALRGMTPEHELRLYCGLWCTAIFGRAPIAYRGVSSCKELSHPSNLSRGYWGCEGG